MDIKQKKSIKLTALFLVLLLWQNAAFAQDLKVKAFVSKNTIHSEERFRLSFEVSGKSTRLPEIRFPDLKDFYVLSGPNESTNIQYVNGAMTSSKTLSFILKPQAKGEFIIGKATVDWDGQKYQSNTVKMTVTKAPAASANPQNKTQAANDALPAGAIFLRTIASKKNAYIGEQILVEYRLYFKTQVRTYEPEKLPANTGFWTEDFELSQRPIIESEVINGVNYNVATLKKVAVFATRVGQLKLDPMVVNVEAVVANSQKRRSLFDSFFEPAGRSVRKQVSSNVVNVTVNALPEKGKPADFSGAVGQFKFTSQIDKTALEVNEAATLKLSISGQGNIKLTELPAVSIPPDIEKYDPKLNSHVSKKGHKISGSKKAEYILIPRIPGEFEIPAITFSYFDPAQKKYIVTGVKPTLLNVTGEATKKTNNPIPGFSRKEVALLGSDIRFLKETTVFSKKESAAFFTPFLLAGFALGVLLLGGFLFYDDKRARLDGNIQLKRNKNAGRNAARFLSEARKLLATDDPAQFYRAISAALSRFVQDKLNIELSDFNTQNAENALLQKQIPAETVSEYLQLIKECDYRQYAPASSEASERERILKQAQNTITQMEKYI